ncbi:MAG: LysR substrate-binding domain-containing protein [Humidesulfovibrio sp.]|nr:LysR substrate-binding domain-containing protein [Humidesulfovibrio sp.]
MELRHLRYFVAVAEELHFGRAADRLHMAQPPLSQQIRALEDELGAQLFARTSRSVRLTPAGEAYLAEARGVLARVEEAGRLVRRVHAGEAGELVLGYMNPVMDAVLCRALAAFRAARPHVALRLRELSTPAQIEELRAGRLDLAFIRLLDAQEGAGQRRDGLATRLVAREPYVLAMPEGHRLAHLSVVPLREAGNEPLILFARASMPALHDAMLAALRSAGAEPRVAQEAPGKHASLALVAAGFGVCLVPASASDWLRRGVVLRPLAPGLPVVEMAAAWRSGAEHPAAQILLDLAAI